MTGLLESVPFAILATGALVAVASATLGTFLVLRGDAMLADATSHGVVFGIGVTWLLTGLATGPVQLLGAAAAGLLTVLLTDFLAGSGRVKEDAAIGLAFPFLFALGVLILNVWAGDVHVDEHTVLLGEIGFVWLDTVPLLGVELPRTFLRLAWVTALDLAFVGLLFKELVAATFDPLQARAAGFRPGALGVALTALLAVTAVASFDAVGVVLFVAFVVVPPATAWLVADRVRSVLWLANGVALASVGLGYAAALAWNVSIGATMALATGPFLLAAFLLAPQHGLLVRTVRGRDRRRRFDARALAVHLYRHEGDPEGSDEAMVGALREHLRWDEAKAKRVLLDGLDEGWVERRGRELRLTPRGRALAREVLEPGRAGEPSPSTVRRPA